MFSFNLQCKTLSVLQSVLQSVLKVTVLAFFLTFISLSLPSVDATAFAGETESMEAVNQRQQTRFTLQNIHEIRKVEIYGNQLMTRSEIAKFRIDLKKIKTQNQLDKFLAAHRQRLDKRAEQRGEVVVE